eukprot:TRINITY_DN39298_c0_g1_i1.p1 TRINITY_DN39298_c0_g1~~TRINITY_DN39298_c0_g1_i1.p1  ORF type:complete len:131 (-),score=20.83 TRINITY_DN39298_c0_g1_i1:27-419(-)
MPVTRGRWRQLQEKVAHAEAHGPPEGRFGEYGVTNEDLGGGSSQPFMSMRETIDSCREATDHAAAAAAMGQLAAVVVGYTPVVSLYTPCLLYTSDAADEEDSGALGGCRILKKKTRTLISGLRIHRISAR